ncbi:MAG: TonB-dependent receptor [Bacteroides sp.]|nr:TonB-dependent receptor [Bacteroides sp.]MCM1379877.1 TonB-dependent receptor [Bacteroides sp.]MCM1446091.1 TonB-dependent receptor [Prevotella sp.]
MKLRISFIITIFTLLCALPSMAAVTIRGKVSHGDGDANEPLEFVSVAIKGTAIGTFTDLDGLYTLSAPEADTIAVTFHCIGYHDVIRKLINSQGSVTLNVKMLPSTELNEVEITEFRKQTDGIQKIDLNTYKLAADASGGTVESLLTTMAGVHSSNELSSQYSVRGGSYDENSVYINGVEIYRPQLISSGQQEGLSVINPAMVKEVNFSTGGFSAEYGDRMSSVLDITYRQPEAFEGQVAASFQGASIAIGQGTKRFSQLHGLRYKRNNTLLSKLETRGEYDPNYFDYQTNINFRFNQKWKVSFLGNIAINNYKFQPQTRETNFGTSTDAKQFTVYFDGQEKDRFETYFGAAMVNFRPSRSSDFTLLASGYHTNELVSYDISGEYWLDQAGTGTVGGELGVGKYKEHARNRLRGSVFTLSLRGNTSIKDHNLSYGLSYNIEKIRDRASEWELRDSSGYSLPYDPDAVRVVYNQSSHHDLASSRLALFAQDSWRLQSSLGYWTINYGLRASYWSFNREFLLSPRASVGFVPEQNNSWAFRFATGLYYQSPFYKEYRQPVEDADGNLIIQLNKGIKSQRSLQFILGTDYSFRSLNRPFKLSAEAYYKALGRLIPYEIDNLKLNYAGVNGGNGYAMGLDLKLFGQFVPGSDSWISFSLMKTQETLNGVKVPRPTDQRYSVALYFTDYFPKFPKLKFSLRGIFSDGLPITPPRSTRDKGYFRTPAYKRVDIGLSYALLSPPKDGEAKRSGFWGHFKSIWLGLDCFNLLDISNVSSYYWVTDINDIQYAVPNYLTRRQFNLRLTIDF